MRAVFEWSRAHGHRTDNPADGRVDALLPRAGHRTVHRASVDLADVVDVLAKVEAIEAPTWHGIKAAFRFAVLTAARTSEVLGMTFAEVDFDTAVWTVPAGRMKAGRAHRVPLSTEALSVLQAQREHHGSTGLVFVSPRNKQLDEASLRRAMRTVNATGTVHGMRGAFKSWCMESGVERAVAELALAHAFMGDTEAAYVRTDLLEQRRRSWKGGLDSSPERAPRARRWSDSVRAARTK